MLDEEFLVRYQLSYGIDQTQAQTQAQPDNSSTSAPSSSSSSKVINPPVPTSSGEQDGQQPGHDSEPNPLKRKAPPKAPEWFELDAAQNTKVYVSNLPLDITEQEFIDLMQKYGLIMKDPQNGDSKVKLYTDSEGNKKGDGLCTYIKVESVNLALQLLDGSDLRGHKIKVERAKFQLKGQYDPSKKPKQKKRKDKEKLKKAQEQLFAWKPDKLRGERAKHERIVVVENAFSPEDFDKDVTLLLEYQDEMREEANKCGKCKKVVVYDRHPQGILQIHMSTPEEADAVITLFNNRFFGGKRISAYTWDGSTKYKIEENETEREQRLKNWENFIAGQEGGSSGGPPPPPLEENEGTPTPPDGQSDDELENASDDD